MTKPARILVIFGTRPEAIKLFPVVNALKADPRFECVVCVSAQHREMLDQVLDIAGIVPDHDQDIVLGQRVVLFVAEPKGVLALLGRQVLAGKDRVYSKVGVLL